MAYLDFAAIKDAVPIEEAARALGLQLKQAQHQLRAPCPACQSGGERALVITPAKKLFYCFALEKGGDVLALTAHVKGWDVKQAAEFLMERFGIGTRKSTRTSLQEPRQQTAPQNEATGFKPLDYLDPSHPSVEALGFDGEVAKGLGIGYAPKGILRGTVAIPIRDERGVLQGYVGATELRLPPSFQSTVVQFPKKTA